MDKFNLEAFAETLKGIGVKTASALRDLLAEKDGAANGGALSARGRLEALFDNGTFSEIGTYVRSVHLNLTQQQTMISRALFADGALLTDDLFTHFHRTFRELPAQSVRHMLARSARHIALLWKTEHLL